MDQHGYGLRDEGGLRVHQSVRTTYAARSFGAGSVVGCMLQLQTDAAELAAAEARDAGASAGPADAARQRAAQEASERGAGRDRPVQT
jgi:hypothetical protein